MSACGVHLTTSLTRTLTHQYTARNYICRSCGGGGTLISLSPARGYACADCVRKHGKEKLIDATVAKDIALMGSFTGERR